MVRKLNKSGLMYVLEVDESPKGRAVVKMALRNRKNSEDEDEIEGKTMIKRKNVVMVDELDKKEYPLRKKTKI